MLFRQQDAVTVIRVHGLVERVFSKIWQQSKVLGRAHIFVELLVSHVLPYQVREERRMSICMQKQTNANIWHDNKMHNGLRDREDTEPNRYAPLLCIQGRGLTSRVAPCAEGLEAEGESEWVW